MQVAALTASALTPLRVTRSIQLATPRPEVFAFQAATERLCEYVPGLVAVHSSAKPATPAKGLIRRCDFGNDMVIEETIVIWPV